MINPMINPIKIPLNPIKSYEIHIFPMVSVRPSLPQRPGPGLTVKVPVQPGITEAQVLGRTADVALEGMSWLVNHGE